MFAPPRSVSSLRMYTLTTLSCPNPPFARSACCTIEQAMEFLKEEKHQERLLLAAITAVVLNFPPPLSLSLSLSVCLSLSLARSLARALSLGI